MIVSVQYLRAIAACMVLLNHVAWKLQQRGGHALDSFNVGEAGVDIFFIISGFIMCHITAHDRSVGRFIRHRLVRIVPLYWLLTTVALMVFLWFPERVNSSGGSTHVLASYLLVPVEGKYLVQAGWTLSYELFFYGVFAAVLRFGRLAPQLAALVLVTLAGVGSWHASRQPIVAFFTRDLLLEFVAGIALYALIDRRVVRHRRQALALLATGTLLFALVNRPAGRGLLTPVRAIHFGVPAFFVCWGSIALERALRRRPLAWLERLGDSSYSLYLSHAFSVGGCALLLDRLPWPARGSALAAVIMVAVALAVGLACWRWVETPMRVRLRARFDPRTRPQPKLAQVAAARG